MNFIRDWPKSAIILILFLFAVSGCTATARQNVIKLTESDIKNVKAMKKGARNLLRTWPFYSGLIRGALGERMVDLPTRAVTSMNYLDSLAQAMAEGKELTDFKLGLSLGHRISMNWEIVREAMKRYAPDIWDLLPAVL